MHRTAARVLLLLPVAAATAAALTGCSSIANTLQRTHEERFDDRPAAVAGWVGVRAPAWLPADSTDIRNRATTDETNAVIRVHSASSLPATCEEVDRVAIPFDSPEWAPQLDAFPDRVQRCGDYEVMPAAGGWFGWFAATEAGQKPE